MKKISLCSLAALLSLSGCYVAPAPQPYYAAPAPQPYYAAPVVAQPYYAAPAPVYYPSAPVAYYGSPVSFGIGIGGGGYWRRR